MTRSSLFLLVLATGCLDAIGPDVGPLATGTTDGGAGTDADSGNGCAGDSNPGLAVSFSTDILNGVFGRGGCTNCHSGNGLGIRQSGLDLHAYTTLRTGGGRSGANIVVDGNACASILVQKIEPGPPFGRRMPYNGPPYLAASDIQLVRDWVAEGAKDN